MTGLDRVDGNHRLGAGVGQIDDPRVFEDLFEHAPCGYVAMTPDGRIVRANRLFGEWVGTERSLVIGRRFSDLLKIGGKIYFETHLAPLLRMQGHFTEVALDIVRTDNATLPVLVNAVERRGEDGRPFAIWLTVFKAIDRRRYEVELLTAREALKGLTEKQVAIIEQAVAARVDLEGTLRQSQKMEVVGQLTAGLAHDFNNILVSVSGAFDMMDRRIQQGREAEIGPYLHAGREAARRAVALVARLLAFSRKQEVEPDVVDVDAVVASLEDMVKRTVGRGVVVQLRLAAEDGKALIDANQLESAVLNLCVNARDAMEGGGTLTVETTVLDVDADRAGTPDIQPGPYIVLSVTDTGTGMSADVASRVLEPFFTTKEEGKGTGLGLAMVLEFTRQSSGGLGIDTQLGRGTTISMYLPRLVDAGRRKI